MPIPKYVLREFFRAPAAVEATQFTNLQNLNANDANIHTKKNPKDGSQRRQFRTLALLEFFRQSNDPHLQQLWQEHSAVLTHNFEEQLRVQCGLKWGTHMEYKPPDSVWQNVQGVEMLNLPGSEVSESSLAEWLDSRLGNEEDWPAAAKRKYKQRNGQGQGPAARTIEQQGPPAKKTKRPIAQHNFSAQGVYGWLVAPRPALEVLQQQAPISYQQGVTAGTAGPVQQSRSIPSAAFVSVRQALTRLTSAVDPQVRAESLQQFILALNTWVKEVYASSVTRQQLLELVQELQSGLTNNPYARQLTQLLLLCSANLLPRQYWQQNQQQPTLPAQEQPTAATASTAAQAPPWHRPAGDKSASAVQQQTSSQQAALPPTQAAQPNTTSVVDQPSGLPSNGKTVQQAVLNGQPAKQPEASAAMVSPVASAASSHAALFQLAALPNPAGAASTAPRPLAQAPTAPTAQAHAPPQQISVHTDETQDKSCMWLADALQSTLLQSGTVILAQTPNLSSELQTASEEVEEVLHDVEDTQVAAAHNFSSHRSEGWHTMEGNKVAILALLKGPWDWDHSVEAVEISGFLGEGAYHRTYAAQSTKAPFTLKVMKSARELYAERYPEDAKANTWGLGKLKACERELAYALALERESLKVMGDDNMQNPLRPAQHLECFGIGTMLPPNSATAAPFISTEQLGASVKAEVEMHGPFSEFEAMKMVRQIALLLTAYRNWRKSKCDNDMLMDPDLKPEHIVRVPGPTARKASSPKATTWQHAGLWKITQFGNINDQKGQSPCAASESRQSVKLDLSSTSFQGESDLFLLASTAAYALTGDDTFVSNATCRTTAELAATVLAKMQDTDACLKRLKDEYKVSNDVLDILKGCWAQATPQSRWQPEDVIRRAEQYINEAEGKVAGVA